MCQNSFDNLKLFKSLCRFGGEGSHELPCTSCYVKLNDCKAGTFLQLAYYLGDSYLVLLRILTFNLTLQNVV